MAARLNGQVQSRGVILWREGRGNIVALMRSRPTSLPHSQLASM